MWTCLHYQNQGYFCNFKKNILLLWLKYYSYFVEMCIFFGSSSFETSWKILIFRFTKEAVAMKMKLWIGNNNIKRRKLNEDSLVWCILWCNKGLRHSWSTEKRSEAELDEHQSMNKVQWEPSECVFIFGHLRASTASANPVQNLHSNKDEIRTPLRKRARIWREHE